MPLTATQREFLAAFLKTPPKPRGLKDRILGTKESARRWPG
jgi:hypothetical protein